MPSRLRLRVSTRIVLSKATPYPTCSAEPIASGAAGRAFPVATTLGDHNRKGKDWHFLKVGHTDLGLVLFGGDACLNTFLKVRGGSLGHKRSVSFREDCATRRVLGPVSSLGLLVLALLCPRLSFTRLSRCGLMDVSKCC